MAASGGQSPISEYSGVSGALTADDLINETIRTLPNEDHQSYGKHNELPLSSTSATYSLSMCQVLKIAEQIKFCKELICWLIMLS